MTADTDTWPLAGYGLIVSALQDDATGVQAALDGLNRDQVAALTEAAVLSLAQLVRDCVTPDALADLVTAVQAVAADDASNH